MIEVYRFALRLLRIDIELVIRKNRLAVWPSHAHKLLPDEDRIFLREHHAELTELAESGLTVLPDASSATKATAIRRLQDLIDGARPMPQTRTAPACPFCLRPCVGPSHPAYEVLHANDPAVVAARDAAVTAELHEVIKRFK